MTVACFWCFPLSSSFKMCPCWQDNVTVWRDPSEFTAFERPPFAYCWLTYVCVCVCVWVIIPMFNCVCGLVSMHACVSMCGVVFPWNILAHPGLCSIHFPSNLGQSVPACASRRAPQWQQAARPLIDSIHGVGSIAHTLFLNTILGRLYTKKSLVQKVPIFFFFFCKSSLCYMISRECVFFICFF